MTRDIYYNGNEISERCTVISRIAETFIRFGTFEIFKTSDEFTGRYGPSIGRLDILEQLFDYVVETFYPEIDKLEFNDNAMNKTNSEKDELKNSQVEDKIDKNKANLRNLKCKEFFKEVVKRTARTCSLWQCYGYNHGVLNTDNMRYFLLLCFYEIELYLIKPN